MARIVYVDPAQLEQIEPIEFTPPDPVLGEAVREALRKLPAELREIVIQRELMGLTLKEIESAHNLTARETNSRLYEARRQLRHHLADFVFKRWGIQASGICRICGHPKEEIINRMLRGKRKSEAWGSFNRRLYMRTGERFSPPRILIAHLRHLKAKRGGAVENR